MPDTADHRADMYRLATERRKAGKPVWAHKINLADVFHNDGMTFEQKRDAIVARIRATTWFKGYSEYDDLPMFIGELAGVEDVEDFDAIWEQVYDVADYDRVWIATF